MMCGQGALVGAGAGGVDQVDSKVRWSRPYELTGTEDVLSNVLPSAKISTATMMDGDQPALTRADGQEETQPDA